MTINISSVSPILSSGHTEQPADEDEVGDHEDVGDAGEVYEVEGVGEVDGGEIEGVSEVDGRGEVRVIEVGFRWDVVDVGEGVEGIKVGDGEDLVSAERAGRVEVALALGEVPLEGAFVVEDVGVVAARHRGGEERVEDLLEADAAAEVRAEDGDRVGLMQGWLGSGLIDG